MSAETLAIAILLPPGVAVLVWLFYRPSWQHMAGGLLLRSGDRERAADRRRQARGAHDRGELRFQGFDLVRQLDGAKQLGSLADNAAQLAGFVRRKLAFRDAAEEIAEHVGTIVGRLERSQRKMDRCSSAGGNRPVDQEASS